VVAVGNNSYGQCNVGSWSNIVQVSAGAAHTVGLRSDGTVVAVGYNNEGECNVEEWSNIVEVSAGDLHTVGLKNNGTVVAVGSNANTQCNVGGWSNIIHVSASTYHTLGLRSNKTVVAAGSSQGTWVSSWNNISKISAGAWGLSLGLKTDETVVATGINTDGQCDVDDWIYIVDIAAGNGYSVGLDTYGTLWAVGGDNHYGQLNISGWNLGGWITITVPNVVGITQAQAESAITTSGLRVGVILSEYNNDVAAGTVLRQYPASGTKVSNNGSTVWISKSIGPIPGEKYTLSVSVVNGNGIVSPSSGTYNNGTVVNITATPNQGYTVKSWSGTDNDALKSNTNTVTMNNNRNVIVEFEPTSTYLLSLSVEGEGSLEVDPSSVDNSYQIGTLVTLTAIPEDGWKILRWEGDIENTGNNTTNTVIMDSDQEVTVVFAQEDKSGGGGGGGGCFISANYINNKHYLRTFFIVVCIVILLYVLKLKSAIIVR